MADSDSRAGARYATPEILAWLDRVHAPHDAALENVYKSPDATGIPAIQLGQAEAGFLEWLVRFARVKNAVEVGTLAGYSAVRIARATREWPGIAMGAGPRGGLALVRAARAQAVLDGRDFTTPDDVRTIAPAARVFATMSWSSSGTWSR